MNQINPNPPTTAELMTVAQGLLGMTYEDVERLPFVALRRLWSCNQRRRQQLDEAFEAGKVEGRKEFAAEVVEAS